MSLIDLFYEALERDGEVWPKKWAERIQKPKEEQARTEMGMEGEVVAENFPELGDRYKENMDGLFIGSQEPVKLNRPTVNDDTVGENEAEK